MHTVFFFVVVDML